MQGLGRGTGSTTGGGTRTVGGGGTRAIADEGARAAESLQRQRSAALTKQFRDEERAASASVKLAERTASQLAKIEAQAAVARARTLAVPTIAKREPAFVSASGASIAQNVAASQGSARAAAAFNQDVLNTKKRTGASALGATFDIDERAAGKLRGELDRLSAST